MGWAARIPLYTVVSKNDADFVFTAKDSLTACAGGTVDITAASVTAGSSNDLTLTYSTDPFGLTYLYKPNNITTSGTYYVKAVSKKGCTNILPVQVIIGNPQLTVTNPAPVIFPATVDLSKTFTHDGSNTYSYFSDNETNDPVPDYQHVAHTGTYYIKATNSTGCSTVKQGIRCRNAAAAATVIKAVNTFTPNNDGINDYFSISHRRVWKIQLRQDL